MNTKRQPSPERWPSLVLGNLYRFRPHSPFRSDTVVCRLEIDVSNPDKPVCKNTDFLPEHIECGMYIGKLAPNKRIPIFLIGEKTYAINITDIDGPMK